MKNERELIFAEDAQVAAEGLKLSRVDRYERADEFEVQPAEQERKRYYKSNKN